MISERRISSRGIGVVPFDAEVDLDDSKPDKLEHRRVALLGALIVIICVLSTFVLSFQPKYPIHLRNKTENEPHHSISPNSVVNPERLESIDVIPTPLLQKEKLVIPDTRGCLYDLPDEYYHNKHIVTPPDGPVTLVCCSTTKGPLNLAVHHKWAPLGAARFLDMVNSKFFSTRVPLFRVLKGFLVQFGLAGDPKVQKAFHEKGNLIDDPPWLPLGPTGREINGTKRYQKGYWGYAGAGKNSRGTQLIMALEDNLYLGGGSPWEVPFGQLVGEESFITISKIYSKYGEKPSQGKIMNRGVEYTQKEFPLLDYIEECSVSNEGIYWKSMNEFSTQATYREK